LNGMGANGRHSGRCCGCADDDDDEEDEEEDEEEENDIARKVFEKL